MVLLLRRSQRVGAYRGKWAGISGFIEGPPDLQVLIEIDEETGLHGKAELDFIAKGEPLFVEDEGLGVRWLVHPYLFHVHDRSKIRLDWEHEEAKWVPPEDIGSYDTVPMLREILASVYRLGKGTL